MIIISHRIGAIRDVDEIIFLADGRVAEQGSHHALLRRRGYYWKLFKDHMGPRKEKEHVPRRA